MIEYFYLCIYPIGSSHSLGESRRRICIVTRTQKKKKQKKWVHAYMGSIPCERRELCSRGQNRSFHAARMRLIYLLSCRKMMPIFYLSGINNCLQKIGINKILLFTCRRIPFRVNRLKFL